MADIKGIGQNNGIPANNGKAALERHQKAKEIEKRQKSEPKDEVVLSKEALDLTRAGQASRETRKQLENSSHTLAPAGAFSEE